MECTKEITCLQNMTRQIAILSQSLIQMRDEHAKEINELKNGLAKLTDQNRKLIETLNSYLVGNNKFNSTDYQFGIFLLTCALVFIGLLHLIPKSFWESIVDRIYCGARKRYVLRHAYRNISPEVHRRRHTLRKDDIELSDRTSGMVSVEEGQF